ncbi:hypothetical protein ACFVVX_06215 [Kitasatospora sp. NPDC058170]|uniref:hypothetical protein n=1 Tax=Kitasatospora sp. NPDC058170 TaxID=3346364 RepID=UPI0036D84A5D
MADAAQSGGAAGTTDGTVTPPLDDTPFVLSTGGGIFGFVQSAIGAVQTDVSASALVSAFGSKNVQIELETLTAFKKKVDALLASLEGSDAAKDKIAEQRLSAGNLGTGFAESTDLMAAYDKTHAAIAQLSKSFAEQIAKMSEAVAQTAVNYGSNEEHQTAASKAVAKNAGTYTPSAGPNGPAPSTGGGTF